jgi:glucokinase
MLLAGDLGGTKTLLGLFRRSRTARPEEVKVLEFPTLGYPGAAEIVIDFLAGAGVPAAEVEAACLGLPGPVIDQRVKPTNVDWIVDARELRTHAGLEHVWLLNDLEAMAYVVPTLRPEELVALQEGRRDVRGNAALLAAGTGLGQALLINVDGELRPSPSEGGHADFAARTPREIELLQELTRLYGRAHTEHVVCGPGLVNLARFTSRGESFVFRETTDQAELPSRITEAALSGRCAHCAEALEMFVSIFGAAAGNFAMQGMATGGVYIGGGIPPKLLPAFRTSTFIDAFNAKQPMEDLVRRIPVHLILNKHAGLDGAAVYANAMAH